VQQALRTNRNNASKRQKTKSIIASPPIFLFLPDIHIPA
jgi:hypothetical protein